LDEKAILEPPPNGVGRGVLVGAGVKVAGGVSVAVGLGGGVSEVVGLGGKVAVTVGALAICLRRIFSATSVTVLSSSAWEGPQALSMAQIRKETRTKRMYVFISGSPFYDQYGTSKPPNPDINPPESSNKPPSSAISPL
jgi:hypothetical protein